MNLPLARNLRKNQTEAERHLWQFLRNRRLADQKFRRQYPIAPYVVDFICLEKALIIELDGSQHYEQQEADACRTAFLEQQGYQVIRFWDNEVFTNLDGVLERIRLCLG